MYLFWSQDYYLRANVSKIRLLNLLLLTEYDRIRYLCGDEI